VIDHREEHPACPLFRFDQYLVTRLGMFGRIGDEVCKNVMNLAGVHSHQRQTRRRISYQVTAKRLGKGGEVFKG